MIRKFLLWKTMVVVHVISGNSFIEVDNDTLKEISYAKARILIASESSNKIEGEVQLIVNGRKSCVQVVEEETFRTVTSTVHTGNPEAEIQDDEVDNTGDDKDASRNKEVNLADDMERQRKEYSDDKVEEAEKFEEDERDENSDNGSHQSVVGKEPNVEKSPLQVETVGDMAQRNIVSDERFNEESSNSVQGLDSIVQDSQSPLNEECLESINNSSQVQNTEAHEGNEQEQERERDIEDTSILAGGVRVRENSENIGECGRDQVKMVYSGFFMKLISMVVYPFPVHVVFKDFWVGLGGSGGCALFKPIGFRDVSYFQTKKSSGGSSNRPAT
ncbi:hypothetical protein RHGRI_012379 [Rhododendron griersonianum]|uniref:Uncharacterized protein n=1 Tax=Rhododendron griersonianum TaxID=479676 RepID=A0AAV6KQA1_9ERIC|nr:hypothetical protein RHGRI_012379 [Rhododendron griersonianum]